MADVDLKVEDVVHTTFDQVETIDGKKAVSTNYVDETNGASSHNKSKQERRLVLKCDLLLLSLAILIYLVTSWVRPLSLKNMACMTDCYAQDRNNIGNARLMGLQEQLHMSNKDFYNAVMMYCESCKSSTHHHSNEGQMSATSSSCSPPTSSFDRSKPIAKSESVSWHLEPSSAACLLPGPRQPFLVFDSSLAWRLSLSRACRSI